MKQLRLLVYYEAATSYYEAAMSAGLLFLLQEYKHKEYADVSIYGIPERGKGIPCF